MKKTKGKSPRKRKNVGGRPSDYRAAFARYAEKLTVIGATEKEMADFFEVSESTIDKWKKKYPGFLRRISRGRLIHDMEIGESLRDRAKGFRHRAIKIFVHDGEVIKVPYTEIYPPDTPAIKFWLTNRRPHAFKDKVTVEQTKGGLADRLRAARERTEKAKAGATRQRTEKAGPGAGEEAER